MNRTVRSRRLRLALSIVAALSLVFGSSRAGASAQQASSEDAEEAGAWTGPDGDPLPFDHVDELAAFLRGAEIVGMEEVGIGVTGARRLELYREGVRLRAIFHTIDLRRQRVRIGERFHTVFRDSWRSQVAAYRVARLLGIDNVPPTVARTVGEETGSVQLWLENEGLMSDAERTAAGIYPSDVDRWLAQVWRMRVFDALAFNDDRNQGNFLVDDAWNLWMIDHTRAFQSARNLRDPETLTHVDRDLWRRLRELPDGAFRAALHDLLERDQIAALLARRDAVVRHFEQRIDDLGAGEVLYTMHARGPAPGRAKELAGARSLGRLAVSRP